METFPTEKLLSIKVEEYCCIKCDYTTCKKSSWTKHINTKKHNFNIVEKVSPDPIPSYTCEFCSKKYKERTGLWYHSKKCVKIQENLSPNMLLEIVKQNQEFKELLVEQNKENAKLQKQLLDMAKEGKVINNTTNNKFNLQFFLNEQCKDALNLMDFVNTVQLKLSDLDTVGQLGYTEGISKIFIRNLKALDVSKRPIHCSDLKRETLYVKDKDAWEKENEENAKIKKAIKYVANKNIKQIPGWVEENPNSSDTESKKHMEYLHIVNQCMGGKTREQDETFENKIIKNIAKEVMIDK
uniref:C2H2-type domain-containing protein n=1 Tax=viral metagenome TaxID=1070528 RepID=A0A6C0B122_9ZZZZ